MLENRTKYSVGKIGIFEKNEKRCVGRNCLYPGSVEPISAVRFSGNYTRSAGVTVATQTRETHGLYAV